MTRSIGAIPCWSMAAACSGLSRTPRSPPWTLGWSVFTRPSIISGKPVRSEMSRTSAPAVRNVAAVPPVETISTPCLASPAARSSRPVLSESEISARRTGTRSVIQIPLGLAGAAEGPADVAAQCRNFPQDDKLDDVVRAATAVDPDAFHLAEIGAAAAEVPWRRALRTEDRPHAVGGNRCLYSGGEVETDGVGRCVPDLLTSPGLQLVGAAQFLAVIAEHQTALVDHAEAADIAVVARLEPARVIVIAALDRDILDALAERA